MPRLLPFALVAALLACEDSGDPGKRQDPPPAPAVCTGEVPPRSGACPGTTAPAADTVRYVTPSCSGQPCSHACLTGFGFSAGACVDDPPPPPSTAQLVDEGDGTFRDVDTGARWLARPGCAETLGGIARGEGALPFNDTNRWIGSLASGTCGLSDGSVAGSWHMPTFDELVGLVGATGPFTGAPGTPAWSSLEPCSTTAITIAPTTGEIGEHPKGDALTAWPVRRP